MLHRDDVSNCEHQLMRHISRRPHVKKWLMSLKIPHMSHIYERPKAMEICAQVFVMHHHGKYPYIKD